MLSHGILSSGTGGSSCLPGVHIKGSRSQIYKKYTLKLLIATRPDTGVGNERLSGELKVAQGHLTLVCNILTLHNHEVAVAWPCRCLNPGAAFPFVRQLRCVLICPHGCVMFSKKYVCLCFIDPLSPTPKPEPSQKSHKALLSKTCICLQRALLAPGPEVPGRKICRQIGDLRLSPLRLFPACSHSTSNGRSLPRLALCYISQATHLLEILP